MEKTFRKIKIDNAICCRLVDRKAADGFKGSLQAYIEQILDLVSRK